MSLLEARGVVKRFGGVTAVDGVDLRLGRGDVVGLIGPNGAGKTTFFDCLNGFTRPDAGRVHLDGRDITHAPVEVRARGGMGRTFQRLEVFPTMTVEEHLVVATEHAGARRSGDGGGPDPTAILARLGLARHASTRADELPTGTLRRLELARALAARPRVLLLDEPASGLDPAEVTDLAGLLHGIAAEGVGVLVVEHNVGFVLRLARRVVVMNRGRVIAAGDPTAVVEDPQVRAAYLGEPEEGGRW